MTQSAPQYQPLSNFGGMEVRQVESGTVITDPRTGEEAIVTDQEGVALFDILYVTQPTYDRIKAEVERSSSD